MENEPLQVLVVYHAEDTCDAIARWLAAQGCACETYGAAEPALRALRAGPPDVIVADVVLARRRTGVAMRRMRALAPRARLVIVSAPGEFDVTAVRRFDVHDWIVTPVTRGELLRAVEGPTATRAPAEPPEVSRLHAELRQSTPDVAAGARRAQRIARLVAEDLCLPERQVEEVGYAALLKEAGPAALPQRLARVETLIRCVNERYDGTGYPARLRGEAIPLGARIVAVADAYEALARSERGAVAASAEIARRAGTAFDPDVVAAWFRVAERRLMPSGSLSI